MSNHNHMISEVREDAIFVRATCGCEQGFANKYTPGAHMNWTAVYCGGDECTFNFMIAKNLADEEARKRGLL